MGTINYKTSDFITIGYNLKYVDYDDEFYNDIITDYYNQVQYTLEKERFTYFNVAIEPGYYDGFSINIEFNFSVCLDCYTDRAEAQKEITRIKKFLLECINDFECCSVYPGWCTGYADYITTLNDLNAAIAEMRDVVKQTPTYEQYIKIS